MFETRNDLKDKLAAAEAEITRLESEITQAQAAASESVNLSQRVAELTDDLNELTATAAATQSALEAANASISSITAELETEKAKTTPEALQSLALATLAEAGQPAPLAGSEEDASPLTEAQILKKFATMPAGSARSAFYRQYHSILSK